MKKQKSISGQIAKLNPVAREMLLTVLKKLQDGEKINREDVGLLGVNLESVQNIFAVHFFGISRQTITDWATEGAPRNPDGTINLADTCRWLVNREKLKNKSPLKDKKTQAEIERIEAQIGKIREETIPRNEYESRFASWASSFKAFWQQAWNRNRHNFVMRSQEEIDVLIEEFGRKLMEVWCGHE